jgi:hypothetical protein
MTRPERTHSVAGRSLAKGPARPAPAEEPDSPPA